MKHFTVRRVSPRRVSRVSDRSEVWPASLTLLAQNHQMRRTA